VAQEDEAHAVHAAVAPELIDAEEASQPNLKAALFARLADGAVLERLTCFESTANVAPVSAFRVLL
jgi:hypothetical protein